MVGLLEHRYSIIRRQLDKLGYKEAFPIDSFSLVEHLVSDILSGNEKYRKATQKYHHVAKIAQDFEHGIEPFKEENVRLIKENSKLRLELFKVQEKSDELKSSNKSRLFELENENSDLKFLVNQFIDRLKKLDLDSLQKTEQLALSHQQNLEAVIITSDGDKRHISSRKQKMEINCSAVPLCVHCLRIRNFVEFGGPKSKKPKALDYLKIADSRIECLQQLVRQCKKEKDVLQETVKSLQLRLQEYGNESDTMIDETGGAYWWKKTGGGVSILSAATNHPQDRTDQWRDEKGQNIEIAFKTAKLQLNILQKRNIDLEQKLKDSILNDHYKYMEGRKMSKEIENEILDGLIRANGGGYPSHEELTLEEKNKFLEAQLSHCCEEKAKIKYLLEQCEEGVNRGEDGQRRRLPLTSAAQSRQNSKTRTTTRTSGTAVQSTSSKSIEKLDRIRSGVTERQKTTTSKSRTKIPNGKGNRARAYWELAVKNAPAIGKRNRATTNWEIGMKKAVMRRGIGDNSNSKEPYLNGSGTDSEEEEEEEPMRIIDNQEELRGIEENISEFRSPIYQQEQLPDQNRYLVANRSNIAEKDQSRTTTNQNQGTTYHHLVGTTEEPEYNNFKGVSTAQGQLKLQDRGRQKYDVDRLEVAAASENENKQYSSNRVVSKKTTPHNLQVNTKDKRREENNMIGKSKISMKDPRIKGDTTANQRQAKSHSRKEQYINKLTDTKPVASVSVPIENESKSMIEEIEVRNKRIDSGPMRMSGIDGTVLEQPFSNVNSNRTTKPDSIRSKHQLEQKAPLKPNMSTSMSMSVPPTGRGAVPNDTSSTKTNAPQTSKQFLSYTDSKKVVDNFPFRSTEDKKEELVENLESLRQNQLTEQNNIGRSILSHIGQTSPLVQPYEEAIGRLNKKLSVMETQLPSNRPEVESKVTEQIDENLVMAKKLEDLRINLFNSEIDREKLEIENRELKRRTEDLENVVELGTESITQLEQVVQVYRETKNLQDEKIKDLTQYLNENTPDRRQGQTTASDDVNLTTGDPFPTVKITPVPDHDSYSPSRQSQLIDGKSSSSTAFQYQESISKLKESQTSSRSLPPAMHKSGSEISTTFIRKQETRRKRPESNEIEKLEKHLEDTEIARRDLENKVREMTNSQALMELEKQTRKNELEKQEKEADELKEAMERYASETERTQRLLQEKEEENLVLKSRLTRHTSLLKSYEENNPPLRSPATQTLFVSGQKDNFFRDHLTERIPDGKSKQEQSSRSPSVEPRANGSSENLINVGGRDMSQQLLETYSARERLLEREILSLKSSLTILDREKDQLNREFERKDKKINQLQNEIEGQTNKITDLELKLKKSEIQIKKNEETSRNYEHDISLLRRQLENLRKDLEEIGGDRENLMKKLREVTSVQTLSEFDRRNIKAELEMRNKETDELKGQIQRYLNEVRLCEELFQEKEEENEQILNQYRALRDEYSELENAQMSLERESDSVRQTTRQAVEQNSSLKGQLMRQSSLVKAYEEQIERLTQQVTGMESQLKTASDSGRIHETDSKVLRDQYLHLERKLDSLRLELANSDSDRKKLEAENRDFKRRTDDLQAVVLLSTQSIARLESLVATFKDSKAINEERIKTVRAEKDQLEEQILTLIDRNEHLHKELAQYRLKFTEATADLERLQRQFENEKIERETAVEELKLVRHQLTTSSASLMMNSALYSRGSRSPSPTTSRTSDSARTQNLLTDQSLGTSVANPTTTTPTEPP